MKKLVITLAVLSIVSEVSAENIFKSLWSSVKSRPDLSTSHSNLSRVGDSFFFYKLKPNQPEFIQDVNVVVTDNELTASEVREVNESHPDNKPHVNIIDNVTETDEHSTSAHNNERDVIYGDKSPLKDTAVLAAWERAEQARKRLEEHRAYMEQVRKARVDIEQSKTISIANQTGVESE
jgi:hypothetical protein